MKVGWRDEKHYRNIDLGTGGQPEWWYVSGLDPLGE